MTESEHLLIVDDDPRICRLLSRYLQREGYKVDAVADGNEMWAALEGRHPELIILDLMLPGVDGITLARQLREKTNIGIIILTGKNDPIDTVVGLEVGADDYVTKPFDNRELLARIRSVLRRLKQTQSATAEEPEEPGSRILTFNGWRMNLDAYELFTPDGELADLGDHEFRLLAILVQNPRHALSRNQILQKLSSRDWMPEDRSVDVAVAKIRKVLEDNPAQPKLIRTIRNVGYQFTGKVESAAPTG